MDKLTKLRNLIADLATLTDGEKAVVKEILETLGHQAVANMLSPEPTIVEAKIALPQGFGDMAKVTAKLSDGTDVEVFKYFSDELHFSAEEFKGMTLEQAHELRHRRDVAFLQS